MNPLEALKQKLMVKPTVEERERVAVVIKGEKRPTKPRVPGPPKTNQNETSKVLEGKEKEEGEEKEKEEEQEEVGEKTVGPIIVDETQKGYDRATLLNKLKESKLTKVLVKPVIEATEVNKVITPIPLPIVKKAKKVTIQQPLVIEGEDEDEENKTVAAIPQEEPKPKKGVKFVIEEEEEEEEGEILKEPKPTIQVEAPKKKERKTKKPEKGVAILGPETIVDIGDTDLTKRLPVKSSPVNIKVSSYYMNNREIFVNFINSLFEPYRIELQKNKNSISCDDIGQTSSDFSLLTHQKIVRDYMNLYTPYRGLLLYHGLGSGKCMKKDTPILMSDGTIKLVQDIKVGDFLMGDDSKPRTVLSLARGKDKMYDIIPVKGDKYTVNQEHILCLKASGFPFFRENKHKSNTNFNIQWIENNSFQSKTFTYNSSIEDNKIEMRCNAERFFEEIKHNKLTSDNIIEISVKDYLNLSKKKKGLLKGYSVPIDFSEKELPFDPYMIGYWLGDGKSRNNALLNTIKDLNMINNKHIPIIYKCNSRENRLKLLAGLLDSDGSLSKKGGFEFTQKNEKLIDDVVYLSRSLGFACYKSEKKTTWTYKGVKHFGKTFRISINGEGIETIPTLIPRKQSESRKQIKDALVTGIKVKYVNEDNYYGFMLDGNCRYLMGNFTVTHNTATSIAIAEGMKDDKRIIIMTPASLRANYIEELKKAGDLLYKRNQFWEWISTSDHPETLDPISAILNLPREYITRHGGAWFINVNKKTNYDELSDIDKKTLEDQLNEMIKQKYIFINYNGLRTQRLEEMTSGFTRNLFDNSVVIIDEAHNLISRIVNKIKKEKTIPENKKGEKEHLPLNLATKLYEFLLSAKNARIVLLSGTPVINYPNEFAILFNILRGYIKTWKIPIVVKTNKKIDRESLQAMLMGEKSLDYIDYTPSSKILTITRNPFGFKNKIKKDSGYQGVSNVKKDEHGDTTIDTESINDDEFERKIIGILRRNDLDIIPEGIEIKYRKALPDSLDEFVTRYINDSDKKLKNVDSLKRRIIGLSSYFRSAQENLLPKYNKTLGVDYHIIRIPMSDFQFKMYETARKEERKTEKPKKKPAADDLFKESSSTYRIFSRLYCNYTMPERPVPFAKKKTGEEGDENNMEILLKEANREENKQDVNDANEGEIEGDEILEKIGGTDYKERLDRALKHIENNSNDFLTPEALQTYGPKFLHMLENIQDPEYSGLHLIYSQFRTMEGIGIFSLVLEKNGFARFRITKNSTGVWSIDIPEVDKGKPTYALYTGTETSEEKELIRHIYNGEWEQIPDNISDELKKMANNNNMGEIIKVFMITSSGSEGINLRNTRYVHIMEPYWHPVRLEQVIGRARRICSHKSLPKALQTVEVFVYLMIFSPEQLKSDEAIELKRKDLSKTDGKTPITSDQYLYEISEIKSNLTAQLTEAIKESAFDCYIYSNGKCVNFGDANNSKFSYVPDYAEQQNDTTVQANKVSIEWVGKPVTLNGVQYVYRRISKNVLNIYDKSSYEAALKDSSIIPLQIGTLETNERGQQVFKQLVT
jgi:hypothetical protein